MEREAEAHAELDKEHSRDPADSTTSIMLARLQRHMGQDEAALELLLKLAVADLVDQDEIIAVVNSLCLRDKLTEALDLARRATVDRPRHPSAWVALSDVLRRTGDPAGARSALQRANQLNENPDGHLLRRAWIAQEEGDIYGLVTHSRRLMELYPNGGVAPWFYASQVKGTPQAELWKMDATRAVGRLHPGDGALDFYGAGWHHVGEPATAHRLIDTGRARDCKRAREETSRANCEAWYSALRRDALNEARKQVEGALAVHPSRSEYLDTLAMVAEAQGDLASAQSAALKAARLSPDDIYLLWQAERLTEAAAGGK
jgi:Flp pilus assembly protein TadD